MSPPGALLPSSPRPPNPRAPSPSQLQLKILAVGGPRAVQGHAAGKYSSSINQPLLFDPSADGVGLDEATGEEDLQYIHIGDREDIVVSGSLLNKKPVRITGSGMGSWSRGDMKREMSALVAALSKMQRPDDVWTAPLSDVEFVWDTEDAKKKRLVLIP